MGVGGGGGHDDDLLFQLCMSQIVGGLVCTIQKTREARYARGLMRYGRIGLDLMLMRLEV